MLSHGDARQRGNYAATQLYFSFATILLSWQSVFTVKYQFISHHLNGHFKYKALHTHMLGVCIHIYTNMYIYISPYISHIYRFLKWPLIISNHIPIDLWHPPYLRRARAKLSWSWFSCSDFRANSGNILVDGSQSHSAFREMELLRLQKKNMGVINNHVELIHMIIDDFIIYI